MATSILEVIQHYQRNIERSQHDGARLLYCIDKLYRLPVKVEHLQETGIGKTVNSLRKLNGEIGVAAKALVTKWKAMVAAEEDPTLASPTSQGEIQRTNGYREPSDDEQNHPQKQQQKSTEERSETVTSSGGGSSKSVGERKTESEGQKEKHHKTHEKSKIDEHASGREKERLKLKELKEPAKRDASTSKHHNSSSSSSKRREETQPQHHTVSKEREKDSRHLKEHKKHASSDHEERNDSKKHKKHKHEKHESGKHKPSTPSSSSSVHSLSTKPSTSSTAAAAAAANAHSPPSLSHKRPHRTDNDNFKCPAPPAKVLKTSKAPKIVEDDEDEDDDGFDSSMGTNFGDVLGMLNMPTKKSKKAASGASRSSSKESPPKSSTSKMNGEKSSTSASSASTSSAVRPAAKPALLTSSVKLEPLDPSIVLELPTISPNYKPMPLNQTVMDCVFNTSNSSASKAQQRYLSEAANDISSKTMRTKIYSGVKTGQIHQVASLFDLCIRVLQKNIDALEYTGGVPFEVLRAVLERATPEQLLVFEEYNPYLMDDSDVLWQQHVQRKYRTQRRQEMETWREMFLRCQDAEARRLSILAESIKQSQKAIAAPVRKTQLAFVDSMVKPPRNVQRKQEQYGTKSKLVATPAARVAALSSVLPNATRVGDARLRVSPATRDAAQVSSSTIRPKKAPLMAKTLQLMRGRNKR